MKTLMYTFAAFTTIAAVAALETQPAQADTQSDRANLVGSWVQTGGNHGWIIESDANGLHVTQIEGSTPIADFECNTMGQACEIKMSGHKATVQMYYNGPALVQLETKDGQIVKRRFSILPNGNSMEVDVTPMTANTQTEKREFERRQPEPAAAKK